MKERAQATGLMGGFFFNLKDGSHGIEYGSLRKSRGPLCSCGKQGPSFCVQAESKSYYGHSAHVTNVKFTHGDQYLISAGGDDSW